MTQEKRYHQRPFLLKVLAVSQLSTVQTHFQLYLIEVVNIVLLVNLLGTYVTIQFIYRIDAISIF